LIFFKTIIFKIYLFLPISNPAPSQVIGRQLNFYHVSGKNFNIMHSHLAGYVRKHFMPVFKFNPKHCIRQSLQYGPLYFNYFFLLRNAKLLSYLTRKQIINLSNTVKKVHIYFYLLNSC